MLPARNKRRLPIYLQDGAGLRCTTPLSPLKTAVYGKYVAHTLIHRCMDGMGHITQHKGGEMPHLFKAGIFLFCSAGYPWKF
jgi:hypothetical protein